MVTFLTHGDGFGGRGGCGVRRRGWGVGGENAQERGGSEGSGGLQATTGGLKQNGFSRGSLLNY